MKINAKTKISKIIRENAAAIDVLAKTSSHLEKLRNPIMRKLIAPRMNIAEAARIGNFEIQAMFDKLLDIGFEIDTSIDIKIQAEQDVAEQNEEKKEFIENRKIEYLDVRPYLERGEDPLNLIQKIIKSLTDDQVLEVVLNFEPVPLIKIEERFGFEILTIIENGIYHTFFKRGANMEYLPTGESKLIKNVEIEEYNQIVANYEKDIIEIDVRMLEMPEPMITILEKLEEMKANPKAALKVFHKRVPQFLIPELEKKQFQTIVCPISEGNVMLFIYRNGILR